MYRHKSLRLLAFVLGWFWLGTGAAEITAFGPETYTRSKGKPAFITKHFSAPAEGSNYRLIAQNAEGKRGRVSSAVISLNGEIIIAPADLNKRVDIIERPVTLSADNEISIELRGEPNSSLIVSIVGDGDIARVGRDLSADKIGIPIGTPTAVTFSTELLFDPALGTPTVTLERIDTSGRVLASEGDLLDDGHSGDLFAGDGTFTLVKQISSDTKEELLFRAHARVGEASVYSSTLSLESYVPISPADWTAAFAIIREAQAYYVARSSEVSKETAALETFTRLANNPAVAKTAKSSDGFTIGVMFPNGMQVILELERQPGTLGGSPFASFADSGLRRLSRASDSDNEIGNNEVLLIAPFNWQTAPAGANEADAIGSLYQTHNNESCPIYNLTIQLDGNATVERFRALSGKGIVQIQTHGALNPFTDEVMLATATKATEDVIEKFSADVSLGTLTISTPPGAGGPYYQITPKFVTKYLKMPNSLIFVSACSSAKNDSMARAFFTAGAKTYLGFSEEVYANYAMEKALAFHDAWINNPQELVTAAEVFASAGGGSDEHGASLLLLGNGGLLAASSKGVEDGSFETASPFTWPAHGDGRVVPMLFGERPTRGHYMGLVSTGLGRTTVAGSLQQKTCLDSKVKDFKFSWNFSSEEFLEYCGSGYQDFFRADLIAKDGGFKTLAYKRIDDLCGAVSPLPYFYDRGDVHGTGWITESIDISAFVEQNVGKPITVRFAAGDVGDSIYDSVILIDDIRAE